MAFRDVQNPGIGGIDEITDAETTFIQNLAGLSYAQGDILYYDGTNLNRLPAGTSGHFLKTQGIGANPTWAAASTGNFADNETPSGSINGDPDTGSGNTTFTLANAPSPAASLILVLNGQVLTAGGEDYTLSGSTITMTVAPLTGGVLRAWYRY